MPLTLNVGVSKKVGELNYGSRGAHVNLELEVDTSLAEHPGQLQARIRELFLQARTAVQLELFGGEAAPADPDVRSAQVNGSSHGTRTIGRRATAGQVRAIHAIANERGMDLMPLLDQQFHVGRAEDLSIGEASELIDWLKRYDAESAAGS